MRFQFAALIATALLCLSACEGSSSGSSEETGGWAEPCDEATPCAGNLVCLGGVCVEDQSGEETGQTQCAPGSKLLCSCPDGLSSKSECNADGTGFLPCDCGGGTEVGGEVGGEVGEEVGGEVGEETGSEVGEETGSEVGEETGSEAGEETGSEAGEETGSEAGEETGTQGNSIAVDPNCIDGQYSEVMADPNGDISSPIAQYAPSNVIAFIQGILQPRYPLGWTLVDGGMNSSLFGESCVDTFLGDTSSAASVIGQMSTIVHECGHFTDLDLGGFSGAGYIINADTTFICSGGGTTQNGGNTFARSLIMNDEYAALHTPCENWGDSNCDDTYAGIYLNGDPTDGNFDSGDQGFDMLFEETVQYVNSLVTSYAYADQSQGSTSARDGILTFLWYVERYLRMARLAHPDAHTFLKNDPCWREAILTVWGRAWLYLETTTNMNALGIDDAKLMGLVMDPELLQEIQLLRDAAGCL